MSSTVAERVPEVSLVVGDGRSSYASFLATKRARIPEEGVDVERDDLHSMLHDWQKEIVQWAAKVGRAAIWADTGLGKTVMQVEWARVSAANSLIVAPLAVTQQTIREAAKVGVTARYVRSSDAVIEPGLWVTNYEMVDHFDPARFGAVVLDEASILKQSDGKTRTKLIQHFADVPRRLSCTATPAPNDPEELTNQAEFLGHMTRTHMLAAYFVHDDKGWRPKGHARGPMLQWMAGWALAIRHPSDMGYPDDGYILPGLEVIPELLPVELTPEDQLFATDLGGVGGRAAVRRETLTARVGRAVELVNTSHSIGSVSTKLTECRGNLNTKPTEKPEWQPTRNIESGSLNSASAQQDLLRKTGNTCAPTTKPTNTDGTNGPQNSKLNTTRIDGSDTPQTPTTASESSPKRAAAIPHTNATYDSAGSLASRLQNSTPSLNDNTDAAPSARPQSEMAPVEDFTSITAMTPAASEESSAQNATLASANSETIPNSSVEHSHISLEPWIIWCGLNAEQDAIAKALGDRAFSIAGSMSPEEKARLLLAWIDGERPVMISKPSILGFGINAQHCARMIFVGLSDSYEQYYQAIRRCYRYGQNRVVRVHVVLSELESQIAHNVARKEREASKITGALVAAMRKSRGAA